jgi:hypothetical protein
MLTLRPSLSSLVTAVLKADPARIPVLIGGCGSGRTTLLHQLRNDLGRASVQYVDVERTATTPERFWEAVTKSSQFQAGDTPPCGARPAFEATLDFFARARAKTGEPATFLLDEFLEFRTFESFPGLRRVVHEFVDGIAASPNRFVLSSRYAARSQRLLRDRAARFEIVHMPPMTADDTLDILGPTASAGSKPSDAAHDAASLAQVVQALSDGRPAYVRALTDELTTMREHAGAESAGINDPVAALMALLAAEGRLSKQCGFSYELRLHRARGYGALKAILEILAEEEKLTLTQISQRLQRTPGSTKDYLSWLEDVDLVASHQKRYRFSDPLLRVWVRLHCSASGPSDDDVAREVREYALQRVPSTFVRGPEAEPAYAMAGSAPAGLAGASGGSGTSGIIEID